MGKLDGKVAIVTGGSMGMGAATARRFIEEGAKVVITAKSSVEQGNALAEELGPNCMFIQQDVTSEADWQNVVKTTEETFGPVSVLFNNAGMCKLAPIETMLLDDYMHEVMTDQVSVFLGMKSVIGSMRKAGGGAIINNASEAALAGYPTAVAYCSAKSAIRAMSKVAAIEFAPDNVRVNTIFPGAIQTRMLGQGDNDEINEASIQASLLKRIADPSEVANLVLFLAVDATYSTGSEFIIDGGLYCQGN